MGRSTTLLFSFLTILGCGAPPAAPGDLSVAPDLTAGAVGDMAMADLRGAASPDLAGMMVGGQAPAFSLRDVNPNRPSNQFFGPAMLAGKAIAVIFHEAS